ncbi:MAG: lytic transglycosylase domain-containing protein [Syntrophomonadaceae bacterium]|nr:lytic transglycosylase domain-containing protein [Syntrophomonadaceae bacterium]
MVLITRKKLIKIAWLFILVFLLIVVTFPKWITVFYPQPHRDLTINAACENDVDPYLVFAIIRAESKYQTTAESPLGAKGLMQIMPETGAWIAEQRGVENFSPDMLHDPDTNIQFGCWYLNNLSKEFEGRLPIIIAAYNAGRGQVKQWIIDGTWDGTYEQLDNVPFEETKIYTRNVMRNYEAYLAIYD